MFDKIMEVSKSVPDRNVLQVFNKLVEEVGELSVEIGVKYLNSYKKAGEGGIKGEAIDILINCLDILYLEGVSENEVNSLIDSKLSKWKRKVLDKSFNKIKSLLS